MSTKITLPRQQGFTLLEIVLVLFLLGLMASSTLFLTEGIEDQAKYDETKHRIEMIRTAILGDSSRTINGRPEISGFASDMGRLPGCIRELLTQRYCDDSEDLPAWEQDPNSQVWAGWRGPYLIGNTELSGEVHFRDGYGNAGTGSGAGSDDWENSGWNFDVDEAGVLAVISLGFDDSNDIEANSLIVPLDYQVTLGTDWQNVDITFTNEQSNHIVIAQDELRLRLNTPLHGIVLNYADDEFDTAAERNTSTQFSNTFPSENWLLLSANGTMQVENSETLIFVPDAVITTGTPNDVVTLTSGMVVTYTDSASVSSEFVVSSKCLPNCTLTLSAGTYTNTSSPLTLDFNSTATLTFNNYYIEPIISENLAKPSIEVLAGATLSSNTVTLPLGATITLPIGTSVLTGTTVIFEGSEITVSEPFVLEDNQVVTANSTDEFIVPVGTSLGSTANSLNIPATTVVTGGAKSFSVLCESNGTPYDGDCSTIGTNSPIGMTLIPRNTLPVKISPLEWVVE